MAAASPWLLRTALLLLLVARSTTSAGPFPQCGQGGATPLEPAADPIPDKLKQVGPCKLPVGDKVLDPARRLYYMPTTWRQRLPFLGTGRDINYSHPWTDGWAMIPDNGDGNGFGCWPGGWCPYICLPPYVEGSFDNYWGLGGYTWSQIGPNTQGKTFYVGAGRRFPTPAGQCGGGQQGLYCSADGTVQARAPSLSGNLSIPGLCYKGDRKVTIENQTPWRITSCRKVFPPDYIGIPLVLEPRSGPQQWPTIDLGRTIPGTQGKKHWASGYTGGFGDQRGVLGLKQYLNIPEVSGTEPCLQPWCQKVNVRPEENTGLFSPNANNAYNPYEIDSNGPAVDPNPNVPETGAFALTLRVNTVGSQGFPVSSITTSNYDTSLGNPRYGVKIYDQSGVLQCHAYWVGGPNVSDCNTWCKYKDCGNVPYNCNATCGAPPPVGTQTNFTGCCVNVPDPRRSQPSAADYPVPVLEGPGLIGPTNQLCAVQWDPTQVNKVVRIVLVENQIKPVT